MALIIDDPVLIAKLTPALVADRQLFVDRDSKLVEAGDRSAHMQIASSAGKLIPAQRVAELRLAAGEDGRVYQLGASASVTVRVTAEVVEGSDVADEQADHDEPAQEEAVAQVEEAPKPKERPAGKNKERGGGKNK